jgi:hypothetical protein
VVQTLSDKRASSLYRSVGFWANNPPNLLRFARALIGEDAVSFVGRAGERGAIVSTISRGSSHIYLQRGASKEENVFALALGIARWDVERGGPATNVRRLALSIALPEEAMQVFYGEGKDSANIAVAYHLTPEIVREREALLVKLRSVSRLRAADAVPHDLAPRAVADAS